VIAAFETEFFASDFCHTMSPGAGLCAKSVGCGLRPVWRDLRSVIGNFLDGITVADIVAGGSRSHEILLPVAATHHS
jgi:DNA-binding IscR family transcriptional regulator